MDKVISSLQKKYNDTTHQKSNTPNKKTVTFSKQKQKRYIRKLVRNKTFAIASLAALLALGGGTSAFVHSSLKEPSPYENVQLTQEGCLEDAKNALLDIIFANYPSSRQLSYIDIDYNKEEQTATINVMTKLQKLQNSSTKYVHTQLFSNSTTKYPKELKKFLEHMVDVNETKTASQKDLQKLAEAIDTFKKSNFKYYKGEIDYADKIDEKIAKDDAKKFTPVTTLLPDSSR